MQHVGIRMHTSAYVSIRQHTSAYVNIRQRDLCERMQHVGIRRCELARAGERFQCILVMPTVDARLE
jgi:hypothetical protein